MANRLCKGDFFPSFSSGLKDATRNMSELNEGVDQSLNGRVSQLGRMGEDLRHPSAGLAYS